MNDIIWWSVNVVVGIGVVVCLIGSIVIVYRGWVFLQVSIVAGWNSDDAAVKHFLGLLNDAKESMVVYDDGNKMEGSIYQDRRVIDAVRQKLSDNPQFKLSCYFNFDEGTAFAEELDGCAGVKVIKGRGDRPEDDVHYKIVDDGLKAHVSRHRLASKARRYRIIDCTKVPKRQRAHVVDTLLKPYKAHAMSVGIW